MEYTIQYQYTIFSQQDIIPPPQVPRVTPLTPSRRPHQSLQQISQISTSASTRRGEVRHGLQSHGV